MASRRTRIKGIANIPQRKKATPYESKEVKSEDTDSKATVDNTQNNEVVSPSKDQDCKTDIREGPIGSSSEQINESDISDIQNINSDQSKTDLEKTTDAPVKNELSSTQTNITRRKFLKPAININVANKRRSQDNKNEEVENLNQLSKKNLVDNEENIAGIHVTEKNSSDIVLNETNLFSTDIPTSRTSVVTFSPNIKHIVPDVQSPALDSDYSVPPSSPTKYNRRIKAVPRLGQRKTSFSASESEDESRRHGRIRNNSVCSVASTIGPDPPTPLSDSMNIRESAPVVQKKICRTDQSRKLAEARKEFHKRFGSTNPDKQKLKMIDLIFYNPSTNPMSQQTNVQSQPIVDSNDGQIESNPEEVVEEEAVDDPAKENNSDNGVPVPQIKIGPSGEIILDEKSLMVENAEVIKQKRKIQNSEVVDGNFDSGYGIYTRVARSKDWSHKETLRFYKALNLIGTDFTTMSKLFPKRSRRELKLKFNKEERINRQLIDKAIMQPCSYNFSELKREIEIEEAEEAAVQKLKEEEIEQRKKNRQSKRGRKRKSLLHTELEQDQSHNASLDSVENNEKVKSSPPVPKKLKSLNIRSVLQSDSDADVSDLETQSDCDDQDTVLPALQQTRSGRMPKIIQRYTEESVQPIKKPRLASLSSYPELNSDKIVPGSIVILPEDNCSDKYKIYMVTPEKKLTALDLSEDVISNIIKERQQNDEVVTPQNCEMNITIPATPQAVTHPIEKETVTETGTYLLL